MASLTFDSVYFNCPIRVSGSRTSIRLASVADGYSFTTVDDGILLSRGAGVTWVPNTSIEYAFVAADKSKAKSKD